MLERGKGRIDGNGRGDAHERRGPLVESRCRDRAPIDGKTLGETPTFDGGTKSFDSTLKPGKYTYYCSVPGHHQAGMQAR